MGITLGGRVGDTSPLGTHGPRRLTDETRAVAHALIRDHGYPLSKAIAIARSVIEKAGATGRWGGVHVRVRGTTQAGAVADAIHQHLLDHAKRK